MVCFSMKRSGVFKALFFSGEKHTMSTFVDQDPFTTLLQSCSQAPFSGPVAKMREFTRQCQKKEFFFSKRVFECNRVECYIVYNRCW